MNNLKSRNRGRSLLFLALALFCLSWSAVFLKNQEKPPAVHAYDPALNAYWDWCYWCNGNFTQGAKCGRSSSNLYSITRRSDGTNKSPLGGPNYGPVNSCIIGHDATYVHNLYSVGCSSLNKNQYYEETGASTNWPNVDKGQTINVSLCDQCTQIINVSYSQNSLNISVRGYNDYPVTEKISCIVSDPHGEGCAHVVTAQSALKFKLDLSRGVTATSGEIDSSSCNTEGDPIWPILGANGGTDNDPRGKRYVCTVYHTFNDIPANGQTIQIAASVKNPHVAGDAWSSSPECNTTYTIPLITPTPTLTPTPTPTPTPSPTPTLTPTPMPPLPMCYLIHADFMDISPEPILSINDEVIFTCQATDNKAPIDHFNFRYFYRFSSSDSWSTPSLFSRVDVPSGQRSANAVFRISDYGIFITQCQSCSTDNDSNCSAWEEFIIYE